jgi:multidrug efflux pump subunit AcrA (membrane-fusion protein)
MKKRQYIILSFVALIIFLIVFALFGRKNKTEEKASEKQTAITYVRTNKAEIKEHDIIIHASGRLGSSRNVLLIAEVQGRLLPGEGSLKGGAQFRSGQLLYGIDDTETRLKMQARKSGFMTMLAMALPDLRIDFPETFPAWEKFFESIDVTKSLPELPEINSVKGKTYLASKNILGEYYSIKADEEMLKKYRVYAPFNGNFIDVFTELGSVVNPGTQIARIIQTGDLEIEVSVSVGEASFLKLGDKVTVFIEGAENPASGKIVRIGQYINANTQSVDVFVAIDSRNDLRMYDGMYVQVEINAGIIKDVVKVPRRAMIDDHHLYVVKDSFLIRTPVRIELRADEAFYIKGVENGTEVVVEALSNPVDSMLVKMLP